MTSPALETRLAPAETERGRPSEPVPSRRVRIETLPAERIDDVVELWRAAGLTRPWNDPYADARLALDGPASTILAGFDANRLLAAAMTGHDGHRGSVYYLAVDPAARSRGYGSEILRACEDWLRERGIPKLNLMVRTDNAAALGFYEAIGYRRDEVVVLSQRLDGATPSAQHVDAS